MVPWIAKKFGLMTLLDPLKTSVGQKLFLKTRWRTADARICPQLINSRRLSRGEKRYGADADGGHIGATW